MAAPPIKPIICIVGPTASGKSELAQNIAECIDGEVVGADSMQVYRGMDIGTGKVTDAHRRVPHHCIDIINPGEPFSAALYQAIARRAFEEIEERGHRSILCGGTGFYVRAAIDDYRFPAGEQVGNEIRERWLHFAQSFGNHALWIELDSKDHESAQLIPENDVKRIVRAFELLEDGTSYSEQKSKLAHIPAWAQTCMYGLSVDPAVLRRRIELRVDQMIENGLIAEVEGLLDSGFRDAITARDAIGYKEIVDALDGSCSIEDAVQRIKTATCRYAKRQRTWFRHDGRIKWIDANDGDMSRMASIVIEDSNAGEP